METLTAISALKLMPTKKTEITNFNGQIKQMLFDGNIHPLELLSNLKAVEKSVKELLSDKEIKEEFIRSMQGDKRRESYGCLFEEVETGTKYDYSVCSQWNEINSKIEELNQDRKSVEDMLKKASSKTPYIDPTTGEAIIGVGKSSETTIKVTIK
jgi:hypothetical protein